MIYIETGSTDVYYNFGLENYFTVEKCLPDTVFLFWRTTPTLMVGKYQNILEEINKPYADAHGIHLVRRMSGGGTIYTDLGGWQFSFIQHREAGEIEFGQYIAPVIGALEEMGVTASFNGRNDLTIDEKLLDDVVTENKEMTDAAKRDLVIALITLKYTQSNSVCYAENGQTIGVGAGQQSRIHCTRLAGEKADKWHLRQHDKVLNLPFKEEIRRPDRDNAIDVYLSEDFEDVIGEGNWQQLFTEKPEKFDRAQQREYLAGLKGVCLGSDAFFPFGDNIERAAKSGVTYIAQPGGSIRDDNVIDTCNKYGMVMAMTGIRLFHH